MSDSNPISSDFVALQTALAGRYSLQRELGRGGMGIVFLAHEVALDRPVALKLLPAEFASREDVRRRFLQEARTAAKLSHPHIVPIFAVDEVDEFVFYAMALIDGETLGERVRTRGPLSDAAATRLLRELGWALAHAHLHGVVHRDVKPDNILLERGTGRALVTDFGIAQVGAVSEAVSEFNGTSQVLGTVDSMSPEQAKGAQVDARSDLYSLGAVGFYAVSGHFPFEGSSASVVLAKHVTEPAPPVASKAPQVSAPLARVIDRCLRKEPDARFADGGAIADALAHDTGVDRPLPVPLRVFIKHLRERSAPSPITAFFLIYFFFVLLISAVQLVPIMAVGGVLVLLTLIALLAPIAVGLYAVRSAYAARKLLRAGHTLEDARLALGQDVIRRGEEFRFEFGDRVTAVDRLAGAVAIGGLVGGAGVLGLLGIAAGGFLIVAGLGAVLFKSVRSRRRADVAGERLLKTLGGWVGDWIFKLGGLGLRDTAPVGMGAHRPTEMAIGLAAGKLFEELPKETRRELAGLPDTVQKLEEDARALRLQVNELNSVLAEIGDDPVAPGGETRARVRAEVEATRDDAGARLRQAVTALEQIRLGLIRMHAGEQVVQNVTMDLRTAKEFSDDMANLLEGRREVERLLAERRATGVFTIVGE